MKTRGFSLIEVLVAILILGVALAGLTQGITGSLVAAKESEQQTQAALLAAAQMESLRAEGYLSAGETEGEGDGDLSAYKWKQVVEASDLDGLFEVTVTIEKDGSTGSIYELKTLLFDQPLTEREREDEAKKKKQQQRRE